MLEVGDGDGEEMNYVTKRILDWLRANNTQERTPWGDNLLCLAGARPPDWSEPATPWRK